MSQNIKRAAACLILLASLSTTSCGIAQASSPEFQAAVEATVTAAASTTPTGSPVRTRQVEVNSGVFEFACPFSWTATNIGDEYVKFAITNGQAQISIRESLSQDMGETVTERLNYLSYIALWGQTEDPDGDTTLQWAESVPCQDCAGSELLSVGISSSPQDSLPATAHYCLYSMGDYDILATQVFYFRAELSNEEKNELLDVLRSVQINEQKAESLF